MSIEYTDMPEVIFYRVTQRERKEPMICALAQERVRAGGRVLICCEDEGQRAKLDEALWLQDPTSFLPHAEWPFAQRHLLPIFLYCSPISPIELRDAVGICDTLIAIPSCQMADMTAFARVIDFADLYDPMRREEALTRFYAWRDAGYPTTVKEESTVNLTQSA